MNTRKIVGAGLMIIALVTIGIFIAQTDFSIQLQRALLHEDFE